MSKGIFASRLPLLTLVLAASLISMSAAPLQAQGKGRPIAAATLGAGTAGLSVSLEASPVSRFWIVGSAGTGFAYGERALGVRGDLLRRSNGAVYAQGLVGQSWCYNNVESRCSYEGERRSGLNAGVGVDLMLTQNVGIGMRVSRWSKFNNDAASDYLERWQFAGLVRFQVR